MHTDAEEKNREGRPLAHEIERSGDTGFRYEVVSFKSAEKDNDDEREVVHERGCGAEGHNGVESCMAIWALPPS